jgi:hypothetical protein
LRPAAPAGAERASCLARKGGSQTTKILAPLAGIVFLSAPALADIYTFSLTIDGSTGQQLGTGPFGTVTVSDTATVGQVDLNINILPNSFILTGQGASTVGFNLQPSVTNLSIVSSTLPGWSLDSSGPAAYGGAFFGNFMYSLNCCSGKKGGGNGQTGSEDLILSGTGLTAASFARLLSTKPGSTPAYFAVDILSQATGQTGFVGATSYTQTVPDGGMTVILLGGVLVALEALRRRFIA